MIKEVNFLLGASFSLLTQIREYLIRKNEVEGIELIEDQFQKLNSVIQNIYYSNSKEKNHE